MAPQYRGYIFDLDGTIYLSDRLIPGADEVVARIRATGGKVSFVSNKTVQTSRDYAAKLNRLGIRVDSTDVTNSTQALIHRLGAIAPGARLMVLGEQPLRDELTRAGFAITWREAETDWVVISMDRTLNYLKLNSAMHAVRHGARMCATNPDRTCPFAEGEVMDAAATIAALEAVTDRTVEFVAGKPSPALVEAAMDRMGLEPRDCVVVGDRLETDIVMAQAAGAAGALVLSGVTARESLDQSHVEPDHVLDSIADILGWLA